MKKLLLTALLCGAASSASASDQGLTSKIEGLFNFEGGNRVSQTNVPADNKNLSSNKKNFALDSEACLAIVASNTVNEMTYGARLGIQTSTKPRSSASYAGSHIFLTNDNYGKFEAGAARNAFDTMSLSAFDIAAGSGDHWDRYVYTPTGEDFESGPKSDSSSVDSDIVYGPESARKVTYYTPLIKETIQFGVSYTPDLSNVSIGSFGTDSTTKNKKRNIWVKDSANATRFNYYEDQAAAKDVVSYAVNLNHNLTDCTDVKISLSGQNGKASKPGSIKIMDADKKVIAGTETKYYKLANFKSYAAGFVLDIGRVSLAGGYEKKLGFTNSIVDGKKKTDTLYNGGVAYNQGPASVSLVYSHGDNKGNKLTSYTLGTQYKLAPGLVPYFEVTRFNGKGGQLAITGNKEIFKSRGTVALIGATVKF